MTKRIRDMNGPIEPNIKPLCDAMNSVPAVRTIASCEGHVRSCSPPYIMFEAPVDFAAALEKELREDAMYTGKLRVFWEVKGMFDGDYALRFSLYSPVLHKLTGHWFSIALLKKRLKADFSVMEEMVKNISDKSPEMQAGDGFFSVAGNDASSP